MSQFNFNNPVELGPYNLGWGSRSAYLTIRKSAMKLGIPFLAKAKLHYGGGYNMHESTPLMTINLMEKLLGGDLSADPENISKDELLDFLNENKIETTGIHTQLGLQFKVLFIDTFVFYRHVFLEEDIAPGLSDYGSLNIRAGIGF